MKHRLAVLLMACAAMTATVPRPVFAAVDFSANIQITAASDFYQPLEPYGSWVTVGTYGRCWHPAHVEADWQPYTVGSWEWTDAGWYWQSDEPWSWACYHYGSWYNQPSVGWVWIPGTDWAPAWVTWRDSDDYVGWAPCGPGLSVLAPSFFVFCDVHHFGNHFRSRRDFVVNNTTIINRTKVVNNFDRRNVEINGHQRTVFENRGPGVDPIKRATGRDFNPRPVRDVINERPRPANVRNDRGRPEQRHETPAPTGRDQQRNYQQPAPEQRPPQQPNVQQQPRPVEPPRPPEQRPPTAPAPRQDINPPVNPPTGRDQPRVYHETPNPTQPPEQRREVPAPQPRQEVPNPQPRPVTPPQQAPQHELPPTGREAPPQNIHPAAPPTQPPAVHQAPAAPHGQDGAPHDGGHDGNKDH